MKKRLVLVCIFITACLLLSVTSLTDGAERFSDLAEKEGQRYHPNGSEPVYVGIFGG